MPSVNFNISVLKIQLILLTQLNLFFYLTWVKKFARKGTKFIS